MIKYPRGAEWRKWDLHLHTPSSYDYDNSNVTNDDIIFALEQNNISVVAVTDHHIIDVERIKDLQMKGKEKGITVFPGIEFLSDARGSEPVHFIAIFSESSDLEYVWGQIKNNTNIKKIHGEGQKESEVYCDLLDTIKLIGELKGITTIHSGSKHSSIEKITNSLDHTMAQKTDIAQAVDIYELGKKTDQEGYKSVVFPKIQKILPMIICSDNHNIMKYELKSNCWLKADPTFEGLKQVINEPEERVFIGEKPPLFDRIATNKTKYIKNISINNVDGYEGTQGKWFDNVSIPINSELVAIIGNKGSGKSAVADILALCSNYHDDKDFSFLTSRKFREKLGKVAKNFKAKLTWEAGFPDEKGLNDSPDSTEILKVKYLPQGQFERLTNEISTVDEFQKEIESVVFSHIPESDRIGATSFDELVRKKSFTVEEQIKTLKNHIADVNKDIIALERKTTDTYKKELENRRKKKEEELAVLKEPEKVSNPNEDPEKKKQNESVNNNISALKTSIDKIEKEIFETEIEKKKLLINLQKLKDTKEQIQQKEIELSLFVSNKKEELIDFVIDFEKLFFVKTDFAEIDKIISTQNDLLENVKKKLGEISFGKNEVCSFYAILKEKQDLLKIETNKLDSEQKRYQGYLLAKVNWEKERALLIGNKDIPDTLEFYKNEIEYLNNNLSNDLAAKYKVREEITKNIFEQKHGIISVYKEVRSQLNSIIESNSDTLNNYKISVDASLVKKNDFSDKFLGYIDKSNKGTFHSKDGGEAQLKTLISETDFDKVDDVITLLNKITEALMKDKRIGQYDEKRTVSDQVKDIDGLYGYLFSLEFLENNYQLKQGDKTLEQLSPGERGALLLVFYLLLDKNNIPLIIDQPEDNLDNHSVATVLVPFIRAAKKKRQIIMVTHNPNLAVVADAEQVIYVNLDKENNYTFSTISGSIEDKEVNKKIVEVLEGAMPAFNTRKKKYYE